MPTITADVRTVVLVETSASASRTEGFIPDTYNRTASATRIDSLLDVLFSANVTYQSNPSPSIIPRFSSGTTEYLSGTFVRLNVTRAPATSVGVARSGYVRPFLLLDTRRPNDNGGIIRGATSVTSTAHLSPLALTSPTIAGSTAVSGIGIGFRLPLAGAITASTVVTGSVANIPLNDNFQDRQRIFDGVRIYANNEGATTQTVYPNDESPSGNSHSVWYSWFPPGSPVNTSGNVVFVASSTHFQPQVRVYPSAITRAHNDDPNTLNIDTDTDVLFLSPWFGSNYTDSDGVMHSVSVLTWNYFFFPTTPGDQFFYYVNVSTSGSGAGGDFWFDYSPGMGPDGTIYHTNASIEPVRVRGNTTFRSQVPLPSGTTTGFVDLAVLTPGSLGDADIPVFIRASTAVTADMSLDSPRIIGLQTITALARQESAPDAVDVSSAVGTGVTSPTKARATPMGGAASDFETLSTLTPYYI